MTVIESIIKTVFGYDRKKPEAWKGGYWRGVWDALLILSPLAVLAALVWIIYFLMLR